MHTHHGEGERQSSFRVRQATIKREASIARSSLDFFSQLPDESYPVLLVCGTDVLAVSDSLQEGSE